MDACIDSIWHRDHSTDPVIFRRKLFADQLAHEARCAPHYNVEFLSIVLMNVLAGGACWPHWHRSGDHGC